MIKNIFTMPDYLRHDFERTTDEMFMHEPVYDLVMKNCGYDPSERHDTYRVVVELVRTISGDEIDRLIRVGRLIYHVGWEEK